MSNNKNMSEWLLDQVTKREKEISEKEQELAKKEESLQWIKWTALLSTIVVLVGFYFISQMRTTDTSGRIDISGSIKKESAQISASKNSQVLDFTTVLTKMTAESKYSHIWGKENIEITPQKELKIFFPQGSFSPSSEPRGGAGFIYKLDQGFETAKLSYKLKFDKGFDFVKGGKLPGFCSLDCPRGGSDVGNGFSTRFMWRKDGDLEGYLYIPGKEGSYGKSFGRGAFRFDPARYYKVEQELKLNTPGKSDGVLVIRIDEKEVFQDSAVKFRDGSDTKIDSVIFSTFFGGSDGSFAATKDMYMHFKDFTISY